MVCESEIRCFMKRYPGLTRQQVLGVMIEAGPERKSVESALARLVHAARPA